MKQFNSELAKRVISGEEFDSQEVIESVLVPCSDLYYNGASLSPLTDTEFDFISRVVKLIVPSHSFFTGVGSDVRGGKIDLPFQMGSLDQVEIGDLDKWKQACNLKAHDTVVVSAKLDGSSGAAIFDKTGKLRIAYSRGNGIQGADITRHLKHTIRDISFDNEDEDVAVRGENIIAISEFENNVQPNFTRSGGQQYLNPRNAVSGMLNAERVNSGVYKHIDFVAYQWLGQDDVSKYSQLLILKSMGFLVPKYEVIPASELTEEYLAAFIDNLRSSYEYEVDGVVVEVNDPGLRQKLAPNAMNPGYAMKYKTTGDDNYVETEVVRVEWNVSKSGYGKPRVIVQPAKLPGITWEFATGYNAKWIVQNGIGPGAIVGGSRCGDVVPNIIKVIKSVKPDMPDDGTYEWTETGVDIIMTGQEFAEDILVQQLTETCRSLDIDGLREGVAAKIVSYVAPDTFVELWETILTWDKAMWVGIIGVNGRKIFDDLHLKVSNIELSDWLGSMPVFGRGVGKRKMKALLSGLDVSSLADFYKLNIDQICKVEGFQVTTAEKIVNGMSEHAKLSKLFENVVQFKKPQATTGLKLSGQKVVMTGFRDAALKKKIEEEGGEVLSSISNKTTIVIAATLSGSSSKLNKVREMIADGKDVQLLDVVAFKKQYFEPVSLGVEF